MALIFINRFFYPDHSATSQILSDVAFALAANGRRVRIIASRQRYDDPRARLAPCETIDGVEVNRVWTSRFGRGDLLGRALDYLTFWASASLELWRVVRAGDVIVAKTDPPLISVFAASIARRRGAHLVNWLQDIYPETAEALGVGRGRRWRPLYGALRALRDRSLRRAAVNVALGGRMAEFLARRGVSPDRIRIIANFADGAFVRSRPPAPHGGLRAAWGLEGAFVVAYSGNLGLAHEYATLLDAIAVVESQQAAAPGAGRIAFLFIGGGARYGDLKRDVAARGLRSVRFEPYQPRERLAESLAAADVHLVCLRPELEGLIVPSKFYGVAAAGRPAIFIGAPDGEIARLIARHGCGRTVSTGDGAGLARTIRELAADPSLCAVLGDRARRAFEAEFDRSIAITRWETLLNDIAAVPATSGQITEARSPVSVRNAR